MKIKANIVIDKDCFFGEIEFDSIIKSISKIGPENQSENYLYPGFIDLHCHGGGGHDVMEGETSIRQMLRLHKKFGTTSLLLTTVTDTPDKLESVFKDIAKVIANPHVEEANILGVHLEGPFLSSQKLGAQPDYVRQFSLEELKKYHAIAPIKILTLAPESGIKEDEIKELKNLGIILQLGHSNATYEEAKDFINDHCQSITHLFNAMSSFHHRAPGVVGACLAHANCAELIPDLIHVHPGAIKLALRSIPDLYFVTDATAASGMPDGDYLLGKHHVTKCSNGVRLKDGTLAGSSLTLNQALQNLLTLGLSPIESSRRLSTIQANLLNVLDRGAIRLGARADFAITSLNGELKKVIKEGI